MRQFCESQCRIEQAKAQNGSKPVAEARERRKDDNRGGGMHGGLASPPFGARPPKFPISVSGCALATFPPRGAWPPLKFPPSVSGYALDTSPPEGVEDGCLSSRVRAHPPPLQGGRCRARRARRRGATHRPE